MGRYVLAAFLIVSFAAYDVNCLLRKFFPHPVKINPFDGDFGDPLFLTPLIENGYLDEARNAARVGPLPDASSEVESYAGYLTVNKEFNSNLFFWYFPTENKSAPVLLWLQGGPGGSSMFGLFNGHGPYKILANGSAIERELAWTKEFSVLYVDNPVGTGFSFTGNDKGYAINQSDVANDMFEGLQQFFTLFSELQSVSFYVTGESYAGKYVPSIAYKIHQEGPRAKMQLKGIAIGDGLCEPESQSDYASFLYQVGLLSEQERDYMAFEQNRAIEYIQEGKFYEAFQVFDLILNGDLIAGPSFFKNATGLSYYFNFLADQEPEEFGYYAPYLARVETRKAIHVGNLTFNDGTKVEQHLINDIMQSIRPWLITLMENYRVLMYSGQLDIIVASALTENFVRSLKWSGQSDFLEADKQIWRVSPDDPDVAGYVRKVHDFHHIIIRNAGHILPYDQPRRGYAMISNFINDRFNSTDDNVH